MSNCVPKGREQKIERERGKKEGCREEKRGDRREGEREREWTYKGTCPEANDLNTSIVNELRTNFLCRREEYHTYC